MVFQNARHKAGPVPGGDGVAPLADSLVPDPFHNPLHQRIETRRFGHHMLIIIQKERDASRGAVTCRDGAPRIERHKAGGTWQAPTLLLSASMKTGRAGSSCRITSCSFDLNSLCDGWSRPGSGPRRDPR